tara:strand:- start:14158 stop:15048 length:891 start_codon:yes stop_codon:yes gene_type:complete
MSKKIYLCLFGGLGNQLFQYAYARNLQIKYKCDLVLDHKTGFFIDLRDKRRFELINYTTKVTKKIIFFFTVFKIYKKIFGFNKKVFSFLNKKLFDETNSKSFKKLFLQINAQSFELYLHGFFQSDKYFLENKSLILKDIMPDKPKNKTFLNLAKKIKNKKSIAICIRRFNEVKSDDIKKVGGKLNENFYNKNLHFFKDKVTKPHFYIFSNEDNYELFNFLKKLHLKKKDYTLVTPSKGFKNPHDTLWLLSLFKYQLISNSTLYWWGAYFAKHRFKKVFVKYPRNFPNKDTVYRGIF